jgi:sigma-E factor negative regulatory protein RseC
MITENGIVTQVDPSTAWVKTIRSSACESCATKDSCHTAGNQKAMIVMVENTLQVKKGDHVVIGIQTRPMLYLTFLLYVFPVILLMIGAAIGSSMAPAMDINPSAFSLVVGFSFFGSAFYFIRKKHNSLSKNNAYKPFLVRKRSQVIPSSCSTS